MEKRGEADLDPRLGILTAVVSFAAALGVSGGTNVVMLLTGNELIKKYRPTLTFRSAIFGDGLIVPLVNLLIMRALVRWRPRLSLATVLLPALGGTGIAMGFHIGQGRGKLVNWTMPQPWRWNLLGYYHFVYMSTQFAYMVLYVSQLAGRWPKGEVSQDQKRDLAIITVSMLGFAALLFTDYY